MESVTRFWLFAGAVLAGLGSLLAVVYASFFPTAAVLDGPGYAAAFGVMALSVSVIVWRANDERGLF